LIKLPLGHSPLNKFIGTKGIDELTKNSSSNLIHLFKLLGVLKIKFN